MIHRSTTGQIRALLDADKNSAGDGPLDPTSTLNRAITRYGITAVGKALPYPPTVDGMTADPRTRNR